MAYHTHIPRIGGQPVMEGHAEISHGMADQRATRALPHVERHGGGGVLKAG